MYISGCFIHSVLYKLQLVPSVDQPPVEEDMEPRDGGRMVFKIAGTLTVIAVLSFCSYKLSSYLH